MGRFKLLVYRGRKHGSPLAKYQLGLDALRGNQCDIDHKKSYFWLDSAANEDIPDAQLALGYEMFTGLRFTHNPQKGLALIKKAAIMGFDHAQVLYSWLLATSLEDDMLNPLEAQRFIDQINPKTYLDTRSYYETQTAAALAQKNWSAAKSALKKLAKLNKQYDSSREREAALRTALKNKQTYRERP